MGLLFTTIQVKPFRFKSSQSYIISVEKYHKKNPVYFSGCYFNSIKDNVYFFCMNTL